MRGVHAPCSAGASACGPVLRAQAAVASSSRPSGQASSCRPSTTRLPALAAADGLGRTFRRGGRGGQCRRAALLVQAAAPLAGTREKIPIFPLSSVALPAAEFPLQIFEARYRVLFSTLLAGSEG